LTAFLSENSLVFLNIPDSSTVWLFRERIIENNKEEEIWEQLQNQLDVLGLKIKKGMIQDATFIISNSGHAKAEKPLGDEANIGTEDILEQNRKVITQQ